MPLSYRRYRACRHSSNQGAAASILWLQLEAHVARCGKQALSARVNGILAHLQACGKAAAQMCDTPPRTAELPRARAHFLRGTWRGGGATFF